MPITRIHTKKHQIELYPADGIVHFTLLTPPADGDATLVVTKVPLTKSEAVTVAARLLEAAVLLPDVAALSQVKQTRAETPTAAQ